MERLDALECADSSTHCADQAAITTEGEDATPNMSKNKLRKLRKQEMKLKYRPEKRWVQHPPYPVVNMSLHTVLLGCNSKMCTLHPPLLVVSTVIISSRPIFNIASPWTKIKKYLFLLPSIRRLERERRKEKRKQALEAGEILPPSRKQLRKESRPPADICVVVDCSYEEYMSENDIKKLVKQLQHCYAINRRAEQPFKVIRNDLTIIQRPIYRVILLWPHYWPWER